MASGATASLRFLDVQKNFASNLTTAKWGFDRGVNKDATVTVVTVTGDASFSNAYTYNADATTLGGRENIGSDRNRLRIIKNNIQSPTIASGRQRNRGA